MSSSNLNHESDVNPLDLLALAAELAAERDRGTTQNDGSTTSTSSDTADPNGNPRQSGAFDPGAWAVAAPSRRNRTTTTTNITTRLRNNPRATIRPTARRNAVSLPRRRQPRREENQDALRRQEEVWRELQYRVSRCGRWCITDAQRIRAEEDKEDEEEMNGKKVELSYEAQLAMENGW